jgi:hypothetical protein
MFIWLSPKKMIVPTGLAESPRVGDGTHEREPAILGFGTTSVGSRKGEEV